MRKLLCLLLGWLLLCQSVSALNAETTYYVEGSGKVGQKNHTAIKLTAFEDALKTATVLHTDSNLAQVRLAKRYIRQDCPTERPLLLDATTYVPVDFAARAFSLYYEESPFVLRDSDSQDIPLTAMEREGVLYLPLRQLCELLGMEVQFDDGLIAIDQPGTLTWLDNARIRAELEEILQPGMAAPAGRTYYVSQRPAANDTNPGTREAPFKTLNRAGELAGPGDTVIVESGTYHEVFRPQKDGLPYAPVTYRAEGDVTLDTTEEVTGFVQYRDNIYVAPVDVNLGRGLNQVFLADGSVIPEARHPNERNSKAVDLSHLNLSPLWPVQGDILVDISEPYVGRSETLLNQEEENYWEGATFVGLNDLGWCLDAGIVTASKKGEIQIGETSRLWWFPGMLMAYPGEDFGYLTGHIHALDAPYEWFIQDNKLYFVKPDDMAAEDIRLRVKTGMLSANLNDRKYVVMDGIDTFGGSMTLDDTTLCMVRNADMQYVSHFTYFKDARDGYVDTGIVQDGAAPQRGEVGIFVNGDSNVFYGCSVYCSAGAAFFTSGKYDLYENNDIRECGYGGTYVGGIYVTFDPASQIDSVRGGQVVLHNAIGGSNRQVFNFNHNNEYWNPWFTPYMPLELAYNDFYNGGLMAGRDGGVINSFQVCLGAPWGYTRIHHNTFMDHYARDDGSGLSCGIYYDAGTLFVESHDNVLFYSHDSSEYTRHYFNNLNPGQDWINIVNSWNQTEVGKRPEGKAGLTAMDYPSGIPFVTGPRTPESKSLPRSETGWFHPAAVSEGAVLEDGFARFTGEDQWVKFEAVDFTDAGNQLNFQVHGDLNQPAGILEVKLDSPDNRPLRTVEYESLATSVEKVDIMQVRIPARTGIHDVYVKVKQDSGVQIGKFSFQTVKEDETTAVVYDDVKIPCSPPSEMGQIKIEGVESAEPTTFELAGLGQGINNTWLGNWFRYDNIEFEYSMNAMTLTGSTQNPFHGNVFEIYVDTMEGEPYAVFEMPDGSWGVKDQHNILLDRMIPAGTHSIYLKVVGPADRSSNIYELAFGYDEAGVQEEE